MAANNTGIGSIPTTAQTYLDTLQAIRNQNILGTDMDAVVAREAELAKYLGATDYAKQLTDAQGMGKLQLALALAQRGFAAAGAPPVRGETPVSTLSRELLSPLAGDAGAVATQMMQQKQALSAAQRQEERQLKLAALQDVRTRDAAHQALALKLMPDPTTDKGVSSVEKDVQFNFEGQPIVGNVVVYRSKDGTTQIIRTLGEHKTKEDGLIPAGTLVSGFSKTTADGTDKQGTRGFARRIGDDGKPTGPIFPVNYTYDGATYKARAVGSRDKTPLIFEGDGINAIYTNEKGETLGSGTGTDKPTVVDMGLAREWIEDPNDPTKLILGPIEETKGMLINGVLRQVVPSPDGTKNVPIKMGNLKGEYQYYEKPPAAAAPTDTRDPEFKATLSGLLTSLPGMRQRMGLGKRGLAFDPAKFNKNPDLTPGENFPFTRVDGMALTEKQQANYARNLENAYFNVFKSIKAGQEKTDLNRAFVTGFLDYDVGSLGLPEAPLGQRLVTKPRDIQLAYVTGAIDFRLNPNAATTIDSLPLPVGPENLRSGTGRLVLYNQLGVPFGETTQAPEVLALDASPADVTARASAVENLDRDDIQTRILAEKEANSTKLGSKLTPRNADTLGKQLPIVGEALEARQDVLTEALNDSAGREIGETTARSLDTIAMLDRLDANMKLSGIGGFVTGPLEQVFRSRLGVDIGAWFRTEEGQEAANELMASLPILQQLVARDLLRGAGEERISDRDLRGVQATLLNINKADDFNADTLRQLRNYLKGSVKHTLDYVGSYHLPDETLHRAAQLGIDVKSIKGRNDYYSPYLADRNYAVSKQPVPSYSKAYQDQLLDDSIFGYVATRGGAGQPTQFRLIKTDDDGKPIPILNAKGQNTGKYQTVLIPKTDGWQAAIEDQAMLDFNRNFLMQTYRLDR